MTNISSQDSRSQRKEFFSNIINPRIILICFEEILGVFETSSTDTKTIQCLKEILTSSTDLMTFFKIQCLKEKYYFFETVGLCDD